MKRHSVIAPEDFEGVHCKWLSCLAGTGLAGNGRCFIGGQWWLKDCPEYESEDIYCSIEEWACEWEFLAGIRPYAWKIGNDDKNPLWLW